MAVLNKRALQVLCSGDKPLIRNAVDLDTQIQQNGIDLTIKRVQKLISRGEIDFDNSCRVLPDMKDIEKIPHYKNGKLGYLLSNNSYLVTFNEIIDIPMDLMGRACPRSSLMRCGGNMNTAVWDAGYEGQSQAWLTIDNEHGVWIYDNARIVQIVMEELNDAVHEGYNGIYQKEGL